MFGDSRSPPKLITNNNRTIYTAGRPPWYNAAGQFEQAFVIGKILDGTTQTLYLMLVAASYDGATV